MANKADILRDKTIAVLDDNRGVSPFFRPKRKRGFHRALKREETWAIMKDVSSKIMQKYAEIFVKEMFKENTMLASIPKDSNLEDKFVGLNLSKDKYDNT